jgi:hypothetical protein
LATAIAVALGWSAAVEAAPITAGNLVVYRVGDGGAALGTAATPVFLDEYTVTGTLVQSIPVPSTGTASLTATGSATAEGLMTLSQDGKSLIFTGYRKDAGGASPSGDPAATTNRVIGSVGLSGVVNTSISLTDVGTSIRSATTIDGSFYYIGASTGVRYAASPGPAGTSVLIDSRNSRQVVLADNNLIVSNGSTAAGFTAKVQSYGPLPTGATTATPLINLAVPDAVNGISLFDLSPTVPGVDTMYIVSQVENLLRKYSFDGSVWTASGSVTATNAANVTGILNGGTVNLFLTTASATTVSTLLPFTDSTGYNASIDGLALDPAIVTAGTNMAFRGVGIIAVPEPSVGILCGLALLVGLRGRRARCRS